VDQQTNDTELLLAIAINHRRTQVALARDHQEVQRPGLVLIKARFPHPHMLEVVREDLLCIELTIFALVLHHGIKRPLFIDVDEDFTDTGDLLTVVIDGRLLDAAVTFYGEFRHTQNYNRFIRSAGEPRTIDGQPSYTVAVASRYRVYLQGTYRRSSMEEAGVTYDIGDPYVKPSFTLGIEEEYMVLDPTTLNLRSHVSLELLSKGRLLLHEHIKPEMHGSMLEIGTGICKNVKEARFEVTKIRSIVAHLARQNGLLIGAASTHPYSRWEDQEIYPDDRYQVLIEDMQLLARSLLIFGMHIHIGIENREVQIQLMNEMRYFLPHILAISTNSPFWEGMDTGLKSYRSKIFERFPRTALPDLFSSWSEYDNYVKLLVKTGSIDNAKKIWWDIRPHPFFPTLEVRICDLPMRIEETIAIAALCQALAAKLYSMYEKNLSFRQYRRSLLMENKWRAVRYGLDGKLIDWGRQKEMPARELVRELLDFVDDVVDELGSRREIEYIYQILEMGSGADRQLRVWKETGSMEEVAKYIHRETNAGLIEDVTPFLSNVQPAAPGMVQETMKSIRSENSPE